MEILDRIILDNDSSKDLVLLRTSRGPIICQRVNLLGTDDHIVSAFEVSGTSYASATHSTLATYARVHVPGVSDDVIWGQVATRSFPGDATYPPYSDLRARRATQHARAMERRAYRLIEAAFPGIADAGTRSDGRYIARTPALCHVLDLVTQPLPIR